MQSDVIPALERITMALERMSYNVENLSHDAKNMSVSVNELNSNVSSLLNKRDAANKGTNRPVSRPSGEEQVSGEGDQAWQSEQQAGSSVDQSWQPQHEAGSSVDQSWQPQREAGSSVDQSWQPQREEGNSVTRSTTSQMNKRSPRGMGSVRNADTKRSRVQNADIIRSRGESSKKENNQASNFGKTSSNFPSTSRPMEFQTAQMFSGGQNVDNAQNQAVSRVGESNNPKGGEKSTFEVKKELIEEEIKQEIIDISED